MITLERAPEGSCPALPAQLLREGPHACLVGVVSDCWAAAEEDRPAFGTIVERLEAGAKVSSVSQPYSRVLDDDVFTGAYQRRCMNVPPTDAALLAAARAGGLSCSMVEAAMALTRVWYGGFCTGVDDPVVVVGDCLLRAASS